MSKIIIVNQSTHHPGYQEVIKASYETWINDSINFPLEVITYYGSSDRRDREIEMDGNVAYVGVGDRVDQYSFGEYDSRGLKFILMLEYVLNNFEFDYLYRTGCTSYVSLKQLLIYLDKLPESRVYTGCLNLHDFTIPFVSGFHVMMSRDTVEVLVRSKDKYLSHKLPEDVCTGMVLNVDLKYIDHENQNFGQSHLNLRRYGGLLNYDISNEHKYINYRLSSNLSEDFYKLHNLL